jgi:hypothetical protein
MAILAVKHELGARIDKLAGSIDMIKWLFGSVLQPISRSSCGRGCSRDRSTRAGGSGGPKKEGPAARGLFTLES